MNTLFDYAHFVLLRNGSVSVISQLFAIISQNLQLLQWWTIHYLYFRRFIWKFDGWILIKCWWSKRRRCISNNHSQCLACISHNFYCQSEYFRSLLWCQWLRNVLNSWILWWWYERSHKCWIIRRCHGWICGSLILLIIPLAQYVWVLFEKLGCADQILIWSDAVDFLMSLGIQALVLFVYWLRQSNWHNILCNRQYFSLKWRNKASIVNAGGSHHCWGAESGTTREDLQEKQDYNYFTQTVNIMETCLPAECFRYTQ